MQHTALNLVAIAACLAAPIASPLAAQEAEETAPVAEPDPALQAALVALDIAPVFDGHNDVPIQLRSRFNNQINGFDFADTSHTGEGDRNTMHTDLARLAEGHVGAQYWSVYVPASLPEPEAVQI